MKLPLSFPSLIQNVSDERDVVQLVNQLRSVAVKRVNAWPQVITTSDATVTTIWSDALPSDSVGDFYMYVVGMSPGAADVAGYLRRAVVRQQGTGGAALVGGVDTIGVDKETDASWDATFAVAGGSITATVTGAVGKTVTWRAHIIGHVLPWS